MDFIADENNNLVNIDDIYQGRAKNRQYKHSTSIVLIHNDYCLDSDNILWWITNKTREQYSLSRVVNMEKPVIGIQTCILRAPNNEDCHDMMDLVVVLFKDKTLMILYRRDYLPWICKNITTNYIVEKIRICNKTLCKGTLYCLTNNNSVVKITIKLYLDDQWNLYDNISEKVMAFDNNIMYICDSRKIIFLDCKNQLHTNSAGSNEYVEIMACNRYNSLLHIPYIDSVIVSPNFYEGIYVLADGSLTHFYHEQQEFGIYKSELVEHEHYIKNIFLSEAVSPLRSELLFQDDQNNLWIYNKRTKKLLDKCKIVPSGIVVKNYFVKRAK